MHRIVIANFYPVWPPVGGGQRRIFFLARELATQFDVEIITPERCGVTSTTIFGDRFRETRVAVEHDFRALEVNIENDAPFASDAAYALHWGCCDQYNNCLRARLAEADVAVTAHPYSIYALLQGRGNRRIPIVFDSQNVEWRQKASVLSSAPRLLQAVRDVESAALVSSQHVIACSRDDAAGFAQDYGVDPAGITIIENGVDALGLPAIPEPVLAAMRARLDLTSRLLAIFGGSYHHPNIRAVEWIIAAAQKTPHVKFAVLGSICRHETLKGRLPENVIVMGEVDESTKWAAFHLADIGLNPMELGSGTNIKMFEYAAAGLAIVSSSFGARGIDLDPAGDFILCENHQLAQTLATLHVGDRARLGIMGETARRRITEIADWSVIGKRYIACLQKLLA